MNKDKGIKNVKKAPAENQTNNTSDYQSGKKSVSGDASSISKKK